MPISKEHILGHTAGEIEIKILDKLAQDPKDRTVFEALEDLTGCPPPEEIDLEAEWKPWPGSAYGHKEYRVKTMTVYVNGEHAGYLDFVFTLDPEEQLAIQFWEMAIHPKFQGLGVFSAMIRKLKEIAKENGVKRLYACHENDNLPAIVTHYALGGKILYVREIPEGQGQISRFGIPRRNELIFVYELESGG